MLGTDLAPSTRNALKKATSAWLTRAAGKEQGITTRRWERENTAHQEKDSFENSPWHRLFAASTYGSKKKDKTQEGEVAKAETPGQISPTGAARRARIAARAERQRQQMLEQSFSLAEDPAKTSAYSVTSQCWSLNSDIKKMTNKMR